MNRLKRFTESKAIFILGLINFAAHFAAINHFVGWICTDTAGYWRLSLDMIGQKWPGILQNIILGDIACCW